MVQRRALGIVAPSGFMPERQMIDRAAEVFAARGWQVLIGQSCFARHQRFAGTDDLRAAELQRFCCDQSLDLVLAARGGYGLTRILSRLDFGAIAAARPTVCGYSDFTAFNLAYLARAGGVSLHGPTATDFGTQTPDAWTLANFFAVLDEADYQTEFDADGPRYEASGLLWGGNLALVCALLGTPYFPRVRGGILFLEDVNEPAYKIERMLLQLEQAGVLGKQKALLLGHFDPVPTQVNDNGFSLTEVIAGLRKRLRIPVVTGLPFGHVTRKLTLPVGATVRLAVGSTVARLGWRRPDFGRAARSMGRVRAGGARAGPAP
ncbi:MAG: LD-carboxypeptidase [Sutterellaceae bacterium]|nr:LD-carboxypeptidase [Burkholderiaceae bacterium]MDW8431045.1 LD-carboxypeptidase [Sutterellaceae bacterium]